VFVALFHSILGLRAVELSAAEQLRDAGHHVVVPDLFAGATAGNIDAGFALIERIGWDTIVQRAHDALADVPDEAVLGGFSMGVGVVGALWPERLEAAGAFLLHAPTLVPPGLRTGTPVQLHVGTNDPSAPPDQVSAFRDSAERAGAAASVHQYPGVGHFFTDVTLPEHDAAAAASTWNHVGSLLDAVG
jgi:dienelactone hydrolase